MSSAKKIFTSFLPFWLFMTLYKFGGGLHYTLMAPYGERFLPVWLVGVLVGGVSFVQLLCDVPAGYLLDRFGYRRLLMVTTAIFMLAALCIAHGLTLFTFLLTSAFSIFGWLFFGPGTSAYVLSHTSEEDSGKFFSLRDTAGSVGIVLASISLPLALSLPPALVGWLLCALLALALLSLSFSPADKEASKRAPLIPTHHFYRRREQLAALLKAVTRLNPASGMLLLLSFVGAVFYGTIWFVVPLLIEQQQAHSGVMSLGLGIFDFSVVVLGYLFGMLADKTDRRALTFVGLLVFSIGGLLVGLDFSWLFLLFGFLATSGDEMASVSLWSWLHTLDREHAADGTVSGVITLAEDFGWTVGPVVAGISYTLTGATGAIIIGALPILIVWLFYYAAVHKHFPHLSEFSGSIIPPKPHRRRHKS